MDGYQRLPFDAFKLLLSKIDISITVKQVEAKYANSGKGRPHYPVSSMLLALLFMRFEAIPSLRKLCRRLEKRRYAREIREICEFIGDRTPKHNTFTLFIGRAGPTLIEGIFTELRDQAFNMGIVDKDGSVKVSVDSTFLKAYSRRGPKGGKSDRGARVGKTDRRNCELGWRAHTATSMSTFPLTYVVRAANVNDKNVVKPLLKQAPRLLACYGKRISHVIADMQYYSSEAFSMIGKLELNRLFRVRLTSRSR